jgi:methionyl-tRNA formyltransferase
MDEQMDTGDIIFQETFDIASDATTQSVLTQAISIAFVGIIKFFTSYLGVLAKPQDNSLATYTLLLKRDDGYISSEILSESLKNGHIETSILPIYTKYLSRNKISIEQIPRQVSLYTLWKALHPWPGLWTTINQNGVKKRLKILSIDPNSPMIIVKVQLEGKRPISWGEFANNYSL